MSDQMILFNGYPFLEKEDKEDDDHAYFEPSTSLLSRSNAVADNRKSCSHQRHEARLGGHLCRRHARPAS